MTLPKLMLDIDASAYTFGPANEVISIQVQGGPSSLRPDMIGAPASLSVQWVLSAVEYNYLMAFWRLSTANGSLPFTVDLIGDYHDVREFECKFMPGTLQLTGVNGDAYSVTATLEIKQLATDAVADASLIAYFATYGVNNWE